MTHEELQHAVRTVAQLCGWEVLHVRRSIGRGRQWVTATSMSGWPDLFCWHPRRQRTLAIELKVPPDRLSLEQWQVLGSLADAGVEVAVWTPEDVEQLGQLLSAVPPSEGASPQVHTRTRVRPSLLPKGRLEL